jgi:hypothetical protein
MGEYLTVAGASRLLDAISGPVTVNEPGVLWTSPTVSLTLTAPNSAILPGMEVIAGDIPAGTFVVSNIGTTVTISQMTTGGTGGDVFFVGPPALVSDVTLHLLTGAIPQSPQTTFGDLTEANYDGYAAVPISSWSEPLSNGAYSWIAGGCLEFVPTDYIVPNTITGIAYTIPGVGAAPPVLLATEIFANPISLALPGDGIQLTPILSVAFDETAGPPSLVLS